MPTKQVHPESSDKTVFCAVDAEYPGSEADNQAIAAAAVAAQAMK
jgi:hypothetical protein